MMDWIEEQFTNWFTDDQGFRRVILIGLPTLAMASFLTVALNMCYVGTFNRASRGFGRRFVAAYQRSALQNLVRREFDDVFQKFENELEDRGMDIDNLQGDVDEFYDRFDGVEDRLRNIDERLENVEEGQEYLTDRMHSTEYEVRCLSDRTYECRDRARSLEADEDRNQWTPAEREILVCDYLNNLYPEDNNDNWLFSVWLVATFSSSINFNNLDNLDFDYYWDVWRNSNQEESDYDEIDENDVTNHDSDVTNHDSDVTNHDSDVTNHDSDDVNDVHDSFSRFNNFINIYDSPSNDYASFNDMS